eukprot:TRINITY_DN1693_c0_g1_i1.p1 TRINITY_DN1693_c0_g1~~TRINITY_DN1693_c0_g1_i1.p1  ORF type:complete len:1035 (+),score=213.54 TRINITY_DN1693_c0_g1_i1:35-3139(+)
MAVEATVAAGAVGATGLGLWGYNRANYLYDAEFRFERFNAAREMAIAQTEQYRADLRALSGLTAAKNGNYAVIASLDMALCIALYCAGRLGLHGPSPPGWIMGLWLTTNAASFGFMALAILFALHANFRAQAASAQLLTRKIRIPVPTLKQLDKARKFASEYEQVAWSDMFRVPYLSNNGAPKTDETSAKVAGSSNRARSSSPGRRSRGSKASTWIREEFDTDRAGTVTGPPGSTLPPDAAPEHYRLYAAVQKEWFEYDIYCRVCLFLGFTAFVQSLAYYSLGHIVVELRAFWVSHACAFTIEVLHVLLLRFDIIQGRIQGKQERTPAFFLWLGPVSVFFAIAGMSIDFRVQFSITGVVFTWICIFVSYGCQFCYQLRLLELILPDDVRNPLKLEEAIGDSWWPSTWRCPSAFAHVLYFVAPPSRLQPGQYDLAREIREGPVHGDPFEQAGVAPQSTKADGAAADAGQEEMAAQIEYVDKLFDYFMSEAVFEAISQDNKQRVKDLFADYSAARRKSTRTDEAAIRTIGECLMGLEAIMTAEGMQQSGGGYSSGSDSGYSSSGSMGSSGSSGSSGDEGIQGYTWDGRRTFEGTTPASPYHKKHKTDPWWMVAVIQTVVCGTWVFMLLGMVVDVFLGDQGLLTAPHWSRPPMTRLSLEPHELGTPIGFPWYAGAKPWIPEQMAWHEEKRAAFSGYISSPHSGKETGGGGHSHIHFDNPQGPAQSSGWARRLTADDARNPLDLHATLDSILAMLPGAQPTKSEGTPVPISWPHFFEPRILACGPHGLAALTPRGVGAVVSPAAAMQHVAESAQTFRLSGLTHLPAILAASWQAPSKELLVLSRAGHISSCPGPLPQAGGVWACASAYSGRLPVPDGSRLVAAAAAWMSHQGSTAPELHAAFIDEATPELVALFKLSANKAWLPLGEVALPSADPVKQPLAAKVSLAFTDGDIIVTTGAGAVLRRRLRDGAVMASSTHPWGQVSPTMQWQGACGLHHGPEGSLAHLRLRRPEGSQAWQPELLTDVQDENAFTGQPLFQ